MNTKPNLYAMALTILARRDYGEAELLKKLQQKLVVFCKKNLISSDITQKKEIDSENLSEYIVDYHNQIENVFKRLKDENLLSEQRVVQQYLLSKGSKFGNHRLKRQLQERGLPTEIVASSVEQYQNENDELSRAREIFLKKFANFASNCTVANSTNKSKQQAIWRFLLYRGFSSATISRLLKEYKINSSNQEYDSMVCELHS